jgi:hypothetical protein
MVDDLKNLLLTKKLPTLAKAVISKFLGCEDA